MMIRLLLLLLRSLQMVGEKADERRLEVLTHIHVPQTVPLCWVHLRKRRRDFIDFFSALVMDDVVVEFHLSFTTYLQANRFIMLGQGCQQPFRVLEMNVVV